MARKPKASLNKAKDIEASKPKRIDIPNSAKAEINRMNQRLEIYLSGIAVGMGIKGKWNVDMEAMQFIIEDTDGKKT